LEEEIWTPKRAVSVAERVPDADEAVKMYQAILSTSKLDADDRFHAEKQALQAAQAIGNKEALAWALGVLAPHLSGDQLQRALQAARNMVNGREGAFAFSVFSDSMHFSASLRATADCLRCYQSCHRHDLLQLSVRIFPIDSLDTEIMDLMFQHLIEVCYEWRWL
jgi:hypothetical protein